MLDDILKVVCAVLEKQTMRQVIPPDEPLGSLGIDSLSLVEVMLDLEEAFPEISLDEYLPEPTVTAREIAIKIDWMKVGK